MSHYNLPTSITNQFPSLVCYFLSGMILLFAYDWITRHWFLIIPSALIYILNYFANVFKLGFLTEITSYLEPLALAILILFLALHLKYLNSVGREKDYSYIIYLYHYPFIMCLIECGIFAKHSVLGIVCVCALSFAAAWLWSKIEDLIKQNRLFVDLK